jgi:GT2 family glycosyltransferase
LRNEGPAIDAVVPFGGGLDLLFDQLDALSRQSPMSLRRIIVSLNCELESADLAQLVRRSSVSSVPIEVVHALSVRGPAHARNVGWRSSTAEYIVFCDADDLVSTGWVDAMRTAFLRAPLIGGRLEYAALNSAADAAWQRGSIDGLPNRWGYLPFTPSSNMGVARQLLVELEGFDETLPVGEDIDFCWRAQQAGHRIEFEPAAVVHYRLRSSLPKMVSQSFRYGLSDGRLIRKHREGAMGPTLSSTLKDAVAVPYFALRALVMRNESWKRPVVIGANLLGHVSGRILRV